MWPQLYTILNIRCYVRDHIHTMVNKRVGGPRENGAHNIDCVAEGESRDMSPENFEIYML